MMVYELFDILEIKVAITIVAKEATAGTAARLTIREFFLWFHLASEKKAE